MSSRKKEVVLDQETLRHNGRYLSQAALVLGHGHRVKAIDMIEAVIESLRATISGLRADRP